MATPSHRIDFAHRLSWPEIRFSYIAPLERKALGFWTWWVGQLEPMMPPALRDALLHRERRDLIEPVEGRFVVTDAAQSASDRPKELRLPIGLAFPAAKTRSRILLLPDRIVLVRDLTLPLAAEENLREILSFEMDRQTPFSADAVYYDALVTGRDASMRTLGVRLIAAPRHRVDELLERATQQGLRPDVVTVRSDVDGSALPVNLLPRREKSVPEKLLGRVNLALGGALLLLLCTAIATPVLQKQHLLEALEPQLADAVTEAKRARELQTEVERLTQGSRYLVERKRSEATALQVIDALTGALPDGTWVDRLDIANGAVRVQGASNSAESLISLLEGSPSFENVRFESPVIGQGAAAGERFSISAGIEGAKRRE